MLQCRDLCTCASSVMLYPCMQPESAYIYVSCLQAITGAPQFGGCFDAEEPVPGLRDLLQTMWADQQYMLEQHVADSISLEEKHKKWVVEHEGKVAAMQQEHQAQLTKLHSKQQGDILKVRPPGPLHIMLWARMQSAGLRRRSKYR